VSELRSADYALDQPLPPSVVLGGSRWIAYRRYPVFSLRWLRGRTVLFAGAIAVFALFVTAGVSLSTGQRALGLLSGSHVFGAFLLMATAGPGLAAWVRHRRWPLRRERVGVVVAVLLGIVVSFGVDFWASARVEQRVQAAMPKNGTAARSIATLEASERAIAIAANLLALALIYGMFGGGLALRAYFNEQGRWQRDQHKREMSRLTRQKRDADFRLGLLQAQVEPHFLFNTLASVRSLLRDDPERAEVTLDALVDYLRASLPRLRDGDHSLSSTLGQQIDLCRAYLALMQVRTGDRLQVRVDMPDALREWAFPPLLLLTLVENAVKHGVEPVTGPVTVAFAAEATDERLQVSVSDDGAGLQPGLGSGVGLANVREQLEARYGGQAAFHIGVGPHGRGVVARIELPREPTG
jgi:sensor histidine kinase YesM